MTTVENISQTEPLTQVETPSFWTGIDAWLERAGERLNPIVVKEARQALKSRQFAITFTLVLVCGWMWSLAGIASVGPSIYFGSSGPGMFMGYYFILAVPLLVIVPFMAYRSLAGEREDRTYELLSITTLRPRQIISGKLASAVLQMLVYLSAMSPCLAFTYLLRGIDMVTILLIVVYTTLGSLALSMLGLLVATLTSQRHWQTALSVIVAGGLIGSLAFAVALTGDLAMTYGFPLDDREFWVVNMILLSAYVSYFALAFLAAASQISFTSENRSTPLRRVMLFQQGMVAGWVGYAMASEPWAPNDLPQLCVVALMLSGVHWFIAGSLLVAEPPQLSPRVRRSLPQTLLGRALLTWMNPGPASGYVFTLTTIGGAAAIAMASLVIYPTTGRSVTAENVFTLSLLGVSYLAIYLGLERLIVAWARRRFEIHVLTGPLLQVLLLLIGCGAPTVLDATLSGFASGYSTLQFTNVVWTVVQILDRQAGVGEVIWIVPLLAMVIFGLNLRAIAREVQQSRLPKPQRVASEDDEQERALRPVVVGPAHPWDE